MRNLSDGFAARNITLANYQAVLDLSGDALPALERSTVLALATATIAALLGAALAFVVERTRLPGRGFLRLTTIVTLAIPGVILAAGYIFAADEIVVMRHGRVAQIGPPAELYARPASAFIAGFLGAANFVPGAVQIEADGRTALRRGDLCLRGVTHAPLGGRGLALLRPEDGTLHAQPPATAGCNLLVGDVVHSEFLGSHWRHVVVVAHDLSLRVLTPAQAPATRVWLHFPFERCLLLPDTP